ncbi:MAG TPA: rhodanese-like domain-containing protein [Cytophagales bacterium]|jgi:rhodanese-related sulfurtransferase|nr:rhodanese-like domain-containing protein [Cytophagales bacterium]
MKKVICVLLLMPFLSIAQQKEVLSPKEFQTKLSDKSAVVLDVRTPEEFKESHLSKAINKNVNDADFGDYSAKLDKKKIYYVYCLAGKRSHKAAVDMRKKGLTVYELEGGIDSWQNAKLPVVK